MLSIYKQFAVTTQCVKPFKSIKLNNAAEHTYLISRRQRISEITSTGKQRKILIPRKESKILASGISSCGSMIAGLISSGQIVVCSKKKRIFQSFLLPPQVKLSIEVLKPDQCTLYIFDRGIVLTVPNDQIWFWKADEILSDPNNLAPHLKGTWLNLNSSNLLKPRSELNSWRSNISDSRPGSNSSRPTTLKSRFTTQAFSIKASDDYIRGSTIGVLRVWLRSINEDSCILESRFLSANLITHHGYRNENSYIGSADDFLYKGHLEFWSKKGHKDMGLVARLDNSSSLAAIGVNSSHPYFCQLVFLNPSNGICTTRKLCNYATVDDIPTTSTDGQTSFWIDDIAWAPNDAFLAVAFKSGFLSVFNRLGEPLAFVLDMIKGEDEPRVFGQTFFTTDPAVVAKLGTILSVDWSSNEIIISDGFTICELAFSQRLNLSDLMLKCIPKEPEGPDVSINISHETNPIPSEIDSGPKAKNTDQAFQLLRSCLSSCHSNEDTKLIIFTLTNWIDTVLPPQLHEEINYTAHPNLRFETEAKLANNLILKKKMHAIDVYHNFSQVIFMESWSMVHNSESREWKMGVAYQVFKYMIADHQALYAWNVLKMFERWIGLRLQRIRNMLIMYCLVQYRNHQANHINVVYYLLAFVATRASIQTGMCVLSEGEEEFLKALIRMNLDVNQTIEVKTESVVSLFYYLNKDVKAIIEPSMNYILGYPKGYSSIYQEICCQLLKNSAKFIDSYLSHDSLLLFAYYFDTSEPLFISPIEVSTAFTMKSTTALDLINNLKKLSQVQVSKDKKLQKDAIFIYWTFRIFQKLEALLPPDVAFFAINKLILVLDNADALNAIQILKSIFFKENPLKLLQLCSPALLPLFQKFALSTLRDNLKNFITSTAFTKSLKKNEICSQLYSGYGSEDLAMHLKIFKAVTGDLAILNEKTENWLDLSRSNFCSWENALGTIHSVLKYFWYIHVKENSESSKAVEWKIRLLAFQDFIDKNQILKALLSEDLEFTANSKSVIALYLRSSMFPANLHEAFNSWSIKIKENPDSLHILHSLEQPAYAQPWIFDSDFLSFCEKIINLKADHSYNVDSIISTWNNSIRSLSRQYQVSGFLDYAYGAYIEVTESEDFDLSSFVHLFNDPSISISNQYLSSEKVYTSSIIQQKKRIILELAQIPQAEIKTDFVMKSIACKKFVYALRRCLKNNFVTLRVEKMTESKENSKEKIRKKYKETCVFYVVKVNNQTESLGNAGLKISSLLDQGVKPVKQKRNQSVIINPVPTERPFQLIRVQKSYA